MHDRDVRSQRRHGVDWAVAVGGLDQANERVGFRQVGLEVAAEREEGQPRGTGRVSPDHAEVAVLLELEWRFPAASQLLGFDPAPDRVEAAHTRIA